eukprot:TRINITY_DN45029_c0_g3_i1.p2 TRINITY_DN45029_c0_g3~~TRINITY_DN45029_c0_g3_i1.p2  ORF type:complete len:107 (-),score=21.82 TRINITY_DN45029_c0_g3_i1:179-499(-)
MLGLSGDSRIRTRSPRGRGSGAKKNGDAKKEEDDDMKTLVSLVGRLSLSTAAKADSAMGMLLDVFLLPEDTAAASGERMAEQIKIKTREYSELTRRRRKRRLVQPM